MDARYGELKTLGGTSGTEEVRNLIIYFSRKGEKKKH